MIDDLSVIQLGYSGYTGGSGGAMAMRNLHFALRKADINSKIICVQGGNEAFGISEIRSLNKIEKSLTL